MAFLAGALHVLVCFGNSVSEEGALAVLSPHQESQVKTFCGYFNNKRWMGR